MAHIPDDRELEDFMRDPACRAFQDMLLDLTPIQIERLEGDELAKITKHVAECEDCHDFFAFLAFLSDENIRKIILEIHKKYVQ